MHIQPFRNGQPVVFNSSDSDGKRDAIAKIVRQLSDSEVDQEVGLMYEIQLAGGGLEHAFADELTAV